ncbi:MAG TPA: hypothetical protein VFE33_04465 [Thermoanaerobaculia bacterium]|nr:hypothetical protein [Thermoanaerobaculia bacterium]
MDDERKSLFDQLSTAGQDLVPVTHRFTQTSATAEATILRLVESRPYRASGYACSGFHKPISKCLSEDDL